MLKLRLYQQEIKNKVYQTWNDGHKNVLMVLPTGGGKTVILTSIVSDGLMEGITSAIIVHRKELVQQISLTLASQKIKHNIIANAQDIRGMIKAHRRVHGQNFYNPYSKVTVISVDTLISRHDRYKHWFNTVDQWICDEAAHVLKDNKWGKACSFFKKARGLGVTATPQRLDKLGLGCHTDGVFNTLVEGPPTKWMINQGYLSKYKIACPPGDFNSFLKDSSTNSDYSKSKMMQASSKSKIVGNVVENYIKHVNNKQAILFATDIKTAKKMEKEFNSKNIIAKSLDGTTPDKERLDGVLNFTEKKIKVLINVDLFDEGLDVPGIEAVIMARPTKSLSKYLQMVGRGLRISDGKSHAVLIDHVGNVMEHGLPCNLRKWSLDRVSKTSKKINLIRICSNVECNSPFDRTESVCPWCNEKVFKLPKGEYVRNVEEVEGDLELIDPEELQKLENRTKLEDPTVIAQRVSFAVNSAAGLRAMKKQSERINAQKELAEAIASWAGKLKSWHRYTDRKIHIRFFLHHNKTINQALSEPAKEMRETHTKLEEDNGF